MPQPWHIQLQIFQRLEKQSLNADSYTMRSEALMQLSICYLLGFGTTQNTKKFLQRLAEASTGSFVAQMILPQVQKAFKPLIHPAAADIMPLCDLDGSELQAASMQSSFGARLCLTQRSIAKKVSQSICKHKGHIIDITKIDCIDLVLRKSEGLSVMVDIHPRGLGSGTRLLLAQIAITGDAVNLRHTLNSHAWSDRDVSVALNDACKHGQFETARLLAAWCPEFIVNEAEPCPLHWLIMFRPCEAAEMLEALIQGPSTVCETHEGPCRKLFDYMPSAGDGTFYFPEHCLDLFGAPLHWAVRARNAALVKNLLAYGAEPNTRWRGRKHYFGDVPRPQIPWTSPLDLAVQYHLSEVADILLSHDAAFVGGAFEEEHCSLHMIGQYCLPLSRYIIHGDSYREALQDTIYLLTRRRKYPIDMPDPNGYTALLRCLQDPEHEFYLVDELLLAGARGDLCLHDNTNAAIIIAQSGSTHTSGLQRLGPLIRDINAVDSLGCNALHYCALNGNKPLAEVLLRIEGIDVNAKASNGDTALHLAAAHASHGSGDVIALLLASNADFTMAGGQEWSALELAVFNRRLTPALMLIEAGASISFRQQKELPGSTVLHRACADSQRQDSMVKELLESCAMLRQPLLLEMFDSCGWTPLYRAAYFGDLEAVASLVDHKANVHTLTIRGKPHTALTIAEETASKARSNLLGVDHKRITDRGEPEVTKLIHRLEEIQLILREALTVAP